MYKDKDKRQRPLLDSDIERIAKRVAEMTKTEQRRKPEKNTPYMIMPMDLLVQ